MASALQPWLPGDRRGDSRTSRRQYDCIAVACACSIALALLSPCSDLLSLLNFSFRETSNRQGHSPLQSYCRASPVGLLLAGRGHRCALSDFCCYSNCQPMRIRIRVLKFICILSSCSSNAFLRARCVVSGVSSCERNIRCYVSIHADTPCSPFRARRPR